VVRQSLLTKSFNIASDELENARHCAREMGISLNKYLRLAVLEKSRGEALGLETSKTLSQIRATVRDSESRSALALESFMADLRAEQSASNHENRDLVVDTLKAFSQFLSPSEPSKESPRKSRPEAATAPSNPTSTDWQRYASGS